jgi:uncharacterized RDD family membrane protein YckC
VNRRVAAHLNRRGLSAVEPESHAGTAHASRRAQEAAARVAARYAHAPSYSEELANEARAAVRAAEAASRAALQAHAAAKSVLAGIEAATIIAPEPPVLVARPARPEPPVEREPEPFFDCENEQFFEREPEPFFEPAPASPAAQFAAGERDNPSFAIRWDPDLPAARPAPEELHATAAQQPPERAGQWQPQATPEPLDFSENETVEPAQPIYANLIEFPRELVAARKARPRLAEAPNAAPEAGEQLSIFEVDPDIAPAEAPQAAAVAETPSIWNSSAWSGMELGNRPQNELGEEEILEDPPEPDTVPPIELAPMSRRLLAAVVDSTLVVGGLLGAAAMVASKASTLPGLRLVEVGVGVALLVAVAFYHVLFFTLARSTPGMKYAQVRLSTLDGRLPTRAQRWGRLAALPLSVAPLGLGLVWSLFDEDHLCWHDRLSRTYLCRS